MFPQYYTSSDGKVAYMILSNDWFFHVTKFFSIHSIEKINNSISVDRICNDPSLSKSTDEEFMKLYNDVFEVIFL